ncbi:hypothetical protein D3C71_1354250 [compost metagenome]
MRGIAQLHILGQVDQHRAGPSFTGDTERFGNHLRQLVDTAHQPAVFDDRHGHAEHIQFLERVGAEQRSAYLSGQAHHRYRVEHRVGDAGDQVGRAGAGRGHAYAYLATGAGVAVGGKRRALFVADQDVLEAGIHQCVIERHDGAARITEQRLHAFGLQGLRQPACAIAWRAVGGSVHAATFACCGRGTAGWNMSARLLGWPCVPRGVLAMLTSVHIRCICLAPTRVTGFRLRQFAGTFLLTRSELAARPSWRAAPCLPFQSGVPDRPA